MRRSWQLMGCLACVVWASCSYVGFDFDAGLFACESDLDCVSGYRCVRSVCGTGSTDSGAADAGVGDSGIVDAGSPDSGVDDAGAVDAGIDAGSTDAGSADAGPADAGTSDAGAVDAGPDPCGAGVMPNGPGSLAAYCAAHRTMVVDGDLSDWAGVPFTVLDNANAGLVKGTTPFTADASANDADLSGKFAVQWDTQYLYVAASMTDDVRAIHAASTSYFADDCFQLYLDGNHDRAGPYGSDDLDLLVRADGADQQFILSSGTTLQGVPTGVLRAVADGANGGAWIIEMAVPWSMLGGSAAVPQRLVGFDLIMDDDDDSATQTRKHYLIWVQNDAGTCTEPYCSTQSLGTIALVGAAP